MKTKTSKSKKSSATGVKNKTMTMSQVRQKAVLLGVKPGKMRKADLIQTIQKTEGYTPCFGSSNGNCPYIDCCFMTDCLRI